MGYQNNQSNKAMLKVVHEDEAGSTGEQPIAYLSKGGPGVSSLMSIVSTNSGGQQNKMSSRERGAKILSQNSQKLQNVYSSNKRSLGGISRQHPQLMNRKASEDKFSNGDSRANMMGIGMAQGGAYSGGRGGRIIEQRYKSHLRGQDVPHHQVGLIRN